MLQFQCTSGYNSENIEPKNMVNEILLSICGMHTMKKCSFSSNFPAFRGF